MTLSSQHAAPADIRPREDDRRQLDVAIGRILAWTHLDGVERREIDLSSQAEIVLPAGCIMLELTVFAVAVYPATAFTAAPAVIRSRAG